MTVARTWAVAMSGVDGAMVEVEADLSAQTPEFKIIGLGDRALSEATQRVSNACTNAGLALPRRRLTVNLTPASMPKHGAGFDLAIALASLATDGTVSAASVARTVHIGELGLDGRVRATVGVLPAVLAASRAGHSRVVVPYANREEAELVTGVEIIAARSLAEVANVHGARTVVPATPVEYDTDSAEEEADTALDLSDVIGQREAVEALVVAAAGGHHLILSGPPGAGKTMLARRLPGILPRLDEQTALTVACVRSLSGQRVRALATVPPLEAPHHSASLVALIGGGSRSIRPGAIARASEGVLFLDEAGEFPASVLDALRQPLERGEIEIHRASGVARYPARFQLVMATNPCPCGNYGVRGAVCACAPHAIRRYLARLSGPLLDRVDIELALRRVSTVAADAPGERMTSALASAAVIEARARAAHRLAATPWRRNVDVSGSWLRDGPGAPDAAVRRPLDVALERGAISLRGYDRVLRLAWTIADLAGRPRLDGADIGRALFMKKGIGV